MNRESMTTETNETNEFYDAVAEHYHLFFRDWRATMERESAYFRRAFRDCGVKSVLDASCGPGTQAIGLAMHRMKVVAADPSPKMLESARAKAADFKVADKVTFVQTDFLSLPGAVNGPFDAVITKGNALTHLLNDADILAALRNFYALLRPGGTVVVGIRDFDLLLEDRPRFVPGQIHDEDTKRDFILFDVWDWNDGPPVTVVFNKFIVSGKGDDYVAKRYPVTYRALRRAELEALMTEAGFVNIKTESQLWEIVTIAQRPE